MTTLRHTAVEIDDDLRRRLVTLLDGTRDRATLLKDLASESSEPLRAENLERSLTGLALLEA